MLVAFSGARIASIRCWIYPLGGTYCLLTPFELTQVFLVNDVGHPVTARLMNFMVPIRLRMGVYIVFCHWILSLIVR
jgi:hypothetical protein